MNAAPLFFIENDEMYVWHGMVVYLTISAVSNQGASKFPSDPQSIATLIHTILYYSSIMSTLLVTIIKQQPLGMRRAGGRELKKSRYRVWTDSTQRRFLEQKECTVLAWGWVMTSRV